MHKQFLVTQKVYSIIGILAWFGIKIFFGRGGFTSICQRPYNPTYFVLQALSFVLNLEFLTVVIIKYHLIYIVFI